MRIKPRVDSSVISTEKSGNVCKMRIQGDLYRLKYENKINKKAPNEVRGNAAKSVYFIEVDLSGFRACRLLCISPHSFRGHPWDACRRCNPSRRTNIRYI